MNDKVEKVWGHINDIGVCMLTTQTGSGLRSRPMMAMADSESNTIRFIADRRQAKDDEIKASPEVGLTFCDTSGKVFLSVTGMAKIDQRQQEVRDHWVSMADLWFDHGKDDPNAILIVVTPCLAEYWEGLGTAAQSIEMIKAKLSGGKPDLGENDMVKMAGR
ncbi:MAG: pyridoxamine 5'-phosphate oxidase family protein [Rhizobiales bacterium]|nr:pyridoxamine 5'-phosphate oxidase family protein [Hyphomicrobiales bacterium]